MDAARHDSPRHKMKEGVVSEGRDRAIKRKRGEKVPIVGHTPSAYLEKLLRPYVSKEIIKAIMTLLSGVPVRDLEAVRKMLSLSDALKPIASDTVLIYETYVKGKNCDKRSKTFPGAATMDDKLEATRVIREDNERNRPKVEREERALPKGWYTYQIHTTDNTAGRR